MPNIVEILITATNEAGKAFAETEASAKGMNDTLTKVGLIGGAALVGIGVKAVEMASTFDSAITNLNTSGGELQSNLAGDSKAILQLSGDVGQSATDLAKAMWSVTSVGFKGADAIKVMGAVAEGAAAEHADLGKVVNGVTSYMVDYHLKAGQAATATSQMIAAVGFGGTSFENFSGAMSRVLPMASELGIKFQDVSAVMAVQTAHEVSARQAAVNTAAAMKSLEKPTAQQSKEFTALGISAKEVTTKLGKDGLTATMQFLSDTAKKGTTSHTDYMKALTLMMGTFPGLQAALMTTDTNAKAVNDAIKGIGSATADAQGHVKGFQEVQKTFAQQWAQIKAKVSELMIELGNKLIPILSSTFDFVGKHGKVFEDLAKFMGLVVGAIVLYTAAAKTAEAVTVLWKNAQLLLDGALEFNPVGLIVVAIAGLVLAVKYLWDHFEGFRNFWKAAWEDIKQVASAVWGFLQPVFTAIVKLAQQAIADIESWWAQHGQAIVTKAKEIWTTVQQDVQIAWDWVSKIIKTVWGDLEQWWQQHGQQVITILSAIWETIKVQIQVTWTIISTIIKVAWDVISVIITTALPGIIKILQGGWDIISGAVKLVWAVISGAIKIAWDTVVGIINIGLDLLTGHWKKAWDDLKAYLSQVWDAIKGAVKLGIDGVETVLSGAVKVIGGAWDAITGLLEAPFQKAYGAITDIIGKIKSAASNIGSTVSGFAHGGIVGAASGGARSNLTMVGEYGRELVKLPAGSRVYSNPDTEAMLGGGSGGGGVAQIIIQSDGTNYSEFLVSELKRLARVRGGGNLQLAIVGRTV